MDEENGETGEIVEFVEFAPTGYQEHTSTLANVDVLSARQVAQVQGAMLFARRFPRNRADSFARIMEDCNRRTLAEKAIYSYPKGGNQIEGPSIRLAEAIAQAWGNIDFGIVEIEQRSGSSTVMAYCVDLETNTRQSKIFEVAHIRRARGHNYELEDPRDIYEMVANQGARRMRNCILAVIPGDVVEAAVTRCNRTLTKGEKTPLSDRVRQMVAMYRDFGVTTAQIEQRLGHNIEATTEQDLITLRKIHTSLRDGASSPAQWFKPMPFNGNDKPDLTMDDLESEPKGAEGDHKGQAELERMALKKEAIELGLVDSSCKYGAERLLAMIEEHKAQNPEPDDQEQMDLDG